MEHIVLVRRTNPWKKWYISQRSCRRNYWGNIRNGGLLSQSVMLRRYGPSCGKLIVWFRQICKPVFVFVVYWMCLHSHTVSRSRLHQPLLSTIRHYPHLPTNSQILADMQAAIWFVVFWMCFHSHPASSSRLHQPLLSTIRHYPHLPQLSTRPHSKDLHKSAQHMSRVFRTYVESPSMLKCCVHLIPRLQWTKNKELEY